MDQDGHRLKSAMHELPTVPFGNAKVTRLISGGNPLVANSHNSAEMNREMASYFTSEEVVRYLQRLVDARIDTVQARGDYRVLQWMELFKRTGGRIQFIVQTASEMADVFENIRVIAATNPLGIYHHGTQTDTWWAQGKIDKVVDYLKCIRDCGVRVGLGTHIPEVIAYSEEKGWDVDFYMASVYNISREPRESAVVSGKPNYAEEFIEEDPPRMYEMIRSTDKTCLAFKVMAAGRRCQSQEMVRQTFRTVFANIKPKDAVVVGMFDKHKPQIRLNVQYTVDACRA